MDFSLYFWQAAVGVVALTPLVPWRAVGKGYHVMMLSVGLGLFAAGWLFRSPGPGAPPAGPPLLSAWWLLWGTLVLLTLAAYALGRGGPASIASLLAAGLGFAGLLLDTTRVLPHTGSAAAGYFTLGFNFAAGALLLGSVLSAMLLGHWYLVVKDLPVRPLKTLTLLFFAALGARLLSTAAAFALDPAGGRAVLDRSFLFVLVYGLFSLGSPIGMSWMIWGTVKIRSTQAATGILYGVTAFILMGEAAGRFVLIKTGFPL
jgi:hypothetical protein